MPPELDPSRGEVTDRSASEPKDASSRLYEELLNPNTFARAAAPDDNPISILGNLEISSADSTDSSVKPSDRGNEASKPQAEESKPSHAQSEPENPKERQDRESRERYVSQPAPFTRDEPHSGNPNDPRITITTGNSGERLVIKRWDNGPQKGEWEKVFENGTVIHYKPDGKGGMLSEETGPDGHKVMSHAYPDGKGGVILERKDLKNPEHSYKAVYGRDGSMVVDWANGNHMERTKDKDGNVHIKHTGPNRYENFDAIERKDGSSEVKFADGSGFRRKDGKSEVWGRLGTVLDTVLPFASASFYDTATTFRLIGAFWMSQAEIVADVRRMNRLY